jgi:hypothetical protein
MPALKKLVLLSKSPLLDIPIKSYDKSREVFSSKLKPIPTPA